MHQIGASYQTSPLFTEVVKTALKKPGLLNKALDALTCLTARTGAMCFMGCQSQAAAGERTIRSRWHSIGSAMASAVTNAMTSAMTNAMKSTVMSEAMLKRLIAALLITSATAAAAQSVYRVVDEDGNVTFTDTPPSGAVAEVQPLNAPNTTPAIPTDGQSTADDSAPQGDDAMVEYDTRITSPADQSTIPMGPGNFVVQVAVRPGLGTGEHLVLTLDGEPVGAPQRTASWQLTNVFRGEHRLQVLRLDANGARQHASAEQVVYVMRPIVRK